MVYHKIYHALWQVLHFAWYITKYITHFNKFFICMEYHKIYHGKLKGGGGRRLIFFNEQVFQWTMCILGDPATKWPRLISKWLPSVLQWSENIFFLLTGATNWTPNDPLLLETKSPLGHVKCNSFIVFFFRDTESNVLIRFDLLASDSLPNNLQMTSSDL